MIASVTGEVEAVTLDRAVVRVGGVGMLVHATPTTLAGLVPGREARLATSLVVREDSLTLFGFADDDERQVFETLQTVSGVGPRLALAMLAVHTPDGLRRAVASEDLAALQRVPGIGKKGAQRIVLEVGEKLGPATGEGAPEAAAPAPAAPAPEVVEALVQLGWSEKVAAGAVEAVTAADGAPADVPGVLRAALQHLGGHRHG
ncbi:Holliday junction branch migration protein RuvA [Georgenia thermotolerans]|uniref:Holliday junction branch migration complex subunit RuvA n=1 Tax=Georgenia thermotolerans TaxID=527326 RepID=A0A7J5UKB9_9MICO|nr:Holliday junction branch migration protein RuvA [Georgenia thermotolerans]KAE8762574.1 Holliday junction branch migration protein RuvA [Georgenia thermotolerans]